MIKRRNPLLAAILSVIASGLGQMYNGQLLKAFLFAPVSFIITTFFALSGLMNSFRGFALFWVVGFLWWLYAVFDAFYISKMLHEISLQRFNKTFFYILFISVCMMLYVLGQDIIVKNVVGLESFRVHMRGMTPTLTNGDIVYVDKKYYNKHQAKINDIILFVYPEDRSAYLFGRIAAIDGDFIIIEKDTITVFSRKKADQHSQKKLKGMTVPQNSAFIVGDNTEVSLDSKTFGPIIYDDIVGKVLYIYCSWDSDNFMVRWNRIGISF